MRPGTASTGDIGPAADQARDVEHERRWTLQAAVIGGALEVGERLILFAESRALPGPLRDFVARRWPRETSEELADARNYIVWHALQVTLADDGNPLVGEIVQELAAALTDVVTAFGRIERARALEQQWRTDRA